MYLGAISRGWEVGAAPSLVVVDEGVAKSLSTTTLRKGIYVFLFDQSDPESTTEELVKALQNRVANLISVPLQNRGVYNYLGARCVVDFTITGSDRRGRDSNCALDLQIGVPACE